MRVLRTSIIVSTLLASFFAVVLTGCGRDDTAPGFDDTEPIEPAPQVPPAAPGNPPVGQPGGLPDAQ